MYHCMKFIRITHWNEWKFITRDCSLSDEKWAIFHAAVVGQQAYIFIFINKIQSQKWVRYGEKAKYILQKFLTLI